MRIAAALCGAIVVFTIVFLSTGDAHYSAFAPELFGHAEMRVLQFRSYRVGVIFNADCAFLLYGRGESGYLKQIAGAALYDRATETAGDYPAGSIPYVMHAQGGRFSGYILFRGHERKFCSEDRAARGCFKE